MARCAVIGLIGASRSRWCYRAFGDIGVTGSRELRLTLSGMT